MTTTGDAPRVGAHDRRDPANATRVTPRTLADAAAGERLQIVRIAGQGAVLQRLQEMGLVRGVEVSVVRFAPLGDPIEIRVRGYSLSLRKSEARCVEVGPRGA